MRRAPWVPPAVLALAFLASALIGKREPEAHAVSQEIVAVVQRRRQQLTNDTDSRELRRIEIMINLRARLNHTAPVEQIIADGHAEAGCQIHAQLDANLGNNAKRVGRCAADIAGLGVYAALVEPRRWSEPGAAPDGTPLDVHDLMRKADSNLAGRGEEDVVAAIGQASADLPAVELVARAEAVIERLLHVIKEVAREAIDAQGVMQVQIAEAGDSVDLTKRTTAKID